MANTTRPGGRAADPVNEFRKATQEVLTLANDTCGVEEIEPGLEHVLEILQRNPESRKLFEGELISLIDSPVEGVVELVSFLMYELRWEAVQEAVREEVDRPGVNVSNIRLFEAMLDSFSDTWGDRDLYARYA